MELAVDQRFDGRRVLTRSFEIKKHGFPPLWQGGVIAVMSLIKYFIFWVVNGNSMLISSPPALQQLSIKEDFSLLTFRLCHESLSMGSGTA